MSVIRLLLLLLSTALVARAVLRRRRYRPLQAGSIAVITGGGSGVGLELAKIFARAGCIVVLIGRNEAALRDAVALCEDAGAPRALSITADISTVDGTDKVSATFSKIFPTSSASSPKIKYLILNAGAGAIAPFSSSAHFTEVCTQLINLNYLANVRFLQFFLPLLSATHSAAQPSRVLVVSSLAGVLPSIMRSGYTASKHAMQGFVNALRGETEVSLTLCCPGYVDTDFHAQAMRNAQPSPKEHNNNNNNNNNNQVNTRRGVPPAVCAKICVEGALHGDAEVIMTLAGKAGYRLRPWLTGAVDYFAKRKSLKSLEK